MDDTTFIAYMRFWCKQSLSHTHLFKDHPDFLRHFVVFKTMNGIVLPERYGIIFVPTFLFLCTTNLIEHTKHSLCFCSASSAQHTHTHSVHILHHHDAMIVDKERIQLRTRYCSCSLKYSLGRMHCW